MSMSTPNRNGSRQSGGEENASSGSGRGLLWVIGEVALTAAGVAALLYFSRNDNDTNTRVTLVEDRSREIVHQVLQTRNISEEKCSICLEPLNSEDSNQPQTFMMRCGHVFHQPCIDTWLRSRERQRQCPNCPDCRAPDPTNFLGLNIHPYCREC